MDHFWTVTLFDGFDVHMNSLIMVWLAMAVLLLFAWATTQKLSVVPSLPQSVGEGVYNFCRSITMSADGKRGDSYLYFIGSLFLFILTANLMGQLPVRLFNPLLPDGGHHMSWLAATGDVNVTTGLAIVSLIMYIAMAIYKTGLGGFVKHHFYPNPFFLPFNLLEHVTRPGSLLIRLYFNILVGEILSHIAISVMPHVLPAAVIFLELFVAVVQAYVFAILSAVYIALMTEDHSHEH